MVTIFNFIAIFVLLNAYWIPKL